MLAIEFAEPDTDSQAARPSGQEAAARGVRPQAAAADRAARTARSCGFIPPLVTTDDEVDQAIASSRSRWRQLRDSRSSQPSPQRVRDMTLTATPSRRMFINGDWADASTSETMPVINPATEETIAEVPKGTEADVDKAVAAARTAFEELVADDARASAA